MSGRHWRPGKSLGAGTLAVLVSAAVHAGQLDYGIGYDALVTDNLTRTPGSDSAFVNIARGLLAYNEHTESVQASVHSILEGRIYAGADTSYDPELLFSLDGRATWAISPRRLTFTVEDIFAQAPTDPTQAVSIVNRQNTNVFSLGPNAYFYPGTGNTLELNARYANAYSQNGAADNNRVFGAARLTRAITPLTNVSINYEPARVDYNDDVLNQDYTRQDVYAGLGTRVWGNTLGFSWGRTTIDRDNEDQMEGTLARVSFGRRITRAASLDLSASREYSDATRATLIVDPSTDVVPPTPTNPEEFVGGGIFYGKNVSALYQYRRDYGVSGLYAYWNEADYLSVPLDQRNHGAALDLGYDFSAVWSASLLADYAKIDYLNVTRNDTDRGAGIRVLHRFRRDTNISFQVRYSERESTLASQNWDEWRGIIGIAYMTTPAAFATSRFLFNDPIYR